MEKSYFNRIRNPLTILALFIGLTEVGFSVFFFQLEKDLQSVFIYFLMGFPTFCALAFFFIWHSKPQSFYGPADFKNEESYLTIARSFDRFSSSRPSTLQSGKKTKMPASQYPREIIEALPLEVCRYLDLVINKPLTLREHQDIMSTVLVSDPKDDPKSSFNQGLSLAYVGFVGNVLLDKAAIFLRPADDKIQIELFPAAQRALKEILKMSTST